ncbi:MliC family protein [Variovorax sp. J2P1-59]|uniref:MliC family protein n=1 Tax=Variovorax flavidus TaxID=3053501 RepID=UPI002577DEA0|nr:MliC family protein [Variovorax sp. J2P1-59]MDM0073937.1 MliC family protein [Variovorax sp. J2P1-59]
MNIARTVSHTGMLLGLLAASQTFAATPSFSCARPEGAAVKAVCSDDMLAALDRETARLYGLARATPGLSAQRKNELTAVQRGWIKGRDDCWKASDATACIRDAYISRIAELRAGYKGARAKGGVSIGPVTVTCPGSPPMSATFVNVEPSLAYLAGSDRGLVMTIARSGSGAKYTGQYPDGEATFWQKGPEAFVQLPGGKDQTCRVGLSG